MAQDKFTVTTVTRVGWHGYAVEAVSAEGGDRPLMATLLEAPREGDTITLEFEPAGEGSGQGETVPV